MTKKMGTACKRPFQLVLGLLVLLVGGQLLVTGPVTAAPGLLGRLLHGPTSQGSRSKQQQPSGDERDTDVISWNGSEAGDGDLGVLGEGEDEYGIISQVREEEEAGGEGVLLYAPALQPPASSPNVLEMSPIPSSPVGRVVRLAAPELAIPPPPLPTVPAALSLPLPQQDNQAKHQGMKQPKPTKLEPEIEVHTVHVPRSVPRQRSRATAAVMASSFATSFGHRHPQPEQPLLTTEEILPEIPPAPMPRPKFQVHWPASADVMQASRSSAPSPYQPMTAAEIKELVEWVRVDKDPALQLTEVINIFAPKVPGSYPILLFLSGIGSNLPDIMYADLLREMAAKQGMIVVGVDYLFTSNPLDLKQGTARAAAVLDWVLAMKADVGLTSYMLNHMNIPRTVVADLSRIILSGHSSGGQIAVRMAQLPEVAPLMSALFLLDPVDGDPFGISERVIPLQKPIRLPLLFVTSGRGGVPGAPRTPACCPQGLDGLHFYEGLRGNTLFYINATAFGHADLLSENLVRKASISHFCASVVDALAHPYGSYRNIIAGAVTAFVNSVFGKCQLSYLIDTDTMPTVARAFHEVAQDEDLECFRGIRESVYGEDQCILGSDCVLQ